MTATQRIALARRELESSVRDVGWERRLVLLVRQALEHAVAEHLAARMPSAERASFSFQLIALRTTLGIDHARRVAWSWDSLSLVCHHKGYAFTPRSNELDAWLEEAEGLL
ncbi:MAG: hypothetical protein GY913_07115 [Proteobacteria bacterium]|nr:hypothetical protein [Pseudomonadota bacterium]MCP4916678.1 hypothetical protein [Pseudomonadota bacterium]